MSDTPSSGTENNPGRREFIGGGSALALGLLLGAGSRIYAEEFAPGTDAKKTADALSKPVNIAVVGLGEQGRAILGALGNADGAVVKNVCDSYENIHGRALEIAPKATACTEYKKCLDDKDIQAIFVATPTHLHKQIVLDALQAGKHVFCEAPLAHTIDDAKAIAKAALAAEKQIFHSGLQERTNPQHKHVLQFIRTECLGNVTQGSAHWHKKTSWRRKAPTDERQNALNWRLNKETSPGLVGEVGIHNVDTANLFLKALPISVTGFGGILGWADGRSVYDTVQCVFQYPGGINYVFDATLTNSFDSQFELFQGTDAAVLIRDQRAWMFKEVDARALGWEVYAFKEKVGDDTGIALVADATKILAAGKQPGENRDVDPKRTQLFNAVDTFLEEIRGNVKCKSGAKEGYAATVCALKANEAIQSGSKIEFKKEWFEI